MPALPPMPLMISTGSHLIEGVGFKHFGLNSENAFIGVFIEEGFENGADFPIW